MIEAISSRWWLLLLRGIAAVIVAVIAFVQPGAALIGLVLVLSIYLLIAGAIAFSAAILGVAGDRWWALLLEGILAVVAAALIWSWPVASALAFVFFVAAWMIVSGIFQIAAGIRLRDFINDEWLYILSGVVSIGFGVFVFRLPMQGAVATAFLIGWYFLVFGILQIAVSIRLRSLHGGFTSRPRPT
jgi:uncharacterized membrane protein HdeD (DUF308 family)